MAFDHEEWFRSLTDEYDIDVPKEALEGYMRQSDYDRKMNELKQEHAQRMEIEDKFHNELMTAQDKLELVQSLEQQYGPAEDWSDALAQAIASQHPQLGNYSEGQGTEMDDINKIIQKQLEDRLREIDNRYQQQLEAIGTGSAIMIDFMSEAPFEFREKFGKKFPKDEFTKFFQNSGTRDPYTAFKLFVEPYEQEKRQKEHEEAIEKAKEEGYQSAMSKYGHVETPAAGPTEGMFFKAPLEGAEVSRKQQQQASGDSDNNNKSDAPAAPPAQPSGPTREQMKQRVGKAYLDALAKGERGGRES